MPLESTQSKHFAPISDVPTNSCIVLRVLQHARLTQQSMKDRVSLSSFGSAHCVPELRFRIRVILLGRRVASPALVNSQPQVLVFHVAGTSESRRPKGCFNNIEDTAGTVKAMKDDSKQC